MTQTIVDPANTLADIRGAIADYLAKTNRPSPSNAAAVAIRDQMIVAISGAPPETNRLAQMIYDRGPSAPKELKLLGARILGGMSWLQQEQVGGLREAAGAMRLALLREIDAVMPDGFAFPPSEQDPWRSAEPPPSPAFTMPPMPPIVASEGG